MPVPLAIMVSCTNGSDSAATTCTPGYYVTVNGTCADCPGIANATSVVCTAADESEATACVAGTYLSGGACQRMVMIAYVYGTPVCLHAHWYAKLMLNLVVGVPTVPYILQHVIFLCVLLVPCARMVATAKLLAALQDTTSAAASAKACSSGRKSMQATRPYGKCYAR
jgi:hypothetical protein